MLLTKALELFLMEQEIRGNSPKTISNYKEFIGYFIKYAGDIDCTLLTLLNLQEYYLHLRQGNLSTISVQTYIRQLRAFLNYMYAEEYITTDLCKKFKLPKAKLLEPDILSSDQITALFKIINDSTDTGLRNACIISLFIDTGIRISELVGLDIQDINFSQNVLKVNGKGNKQRIVPFGKNTKKVLMKYIYSGRNYSKTDVNALFIDTNYNRITQNAIRMLFNRLKKHLGINRLYPHLLRHTFATMYLLNGGDNFSLQNILGHTSLEMVKHYSHLASSYSIGVHQRCSPMDNLGKHKENASGGGEKM